MKFLKALPVLSIATMVALASCKKEGCTDPAASNYSESAKKDDGSCNIVAQAPLYVGKNLTGDITGKVSLDASVEYTVTAGVKVKAGAELHIPAGTVLKGNHVDGTDFIAVEMGGKIFAKGTKDAPIVFTSASSSPEAGHIGGIVICGKGKIGTGAVNVATEIDPTLKYGGNDDSDNSGELSYVRVEYAGKKLQSGEAEFNGFTFYAVGSGTVLNSLSAVNTDDDGFEWFGGAVNATNLVSINSSDDSFDYTEGWIGTAENLLVKVTAGNEGDSGVEGDSGKGQLNRKSNPSIKNLSVEAEGTLSRGIRIKTDGAGTYENVIISGTFAKGSINIDDVAGAANVISGDLSFSKLFIGAEGTIKIKDGAADVVKVEETIEASKGDAAVATAWAEGWSKF